MGIIFDMGNVLALEVDVVPPIAEKLGMTIDRLLEFSRDRFSDLMIGVGSADEYWKAFNEKFHTDVREDLLATLFHPVTDVRVKKLILDLKASGHRVVCGTNTFEKHYRHHLKRGDYEGFDSVYASHLMGVAKPSEAFFEYILRREGWTGPETLFIDDRDANVVSAARLGIRAFLYESFPPLKAWLIGMKALPAQDAGERGLLEDL